MSGDDDQAVPIRFERIEINQPVRRGKHAVGRKIDRAAGRVQSLLALVLIFHNRKVCGAGSLLVRLRKPQGFLLKFLITGNDLLFHKDRNTETMGADQF